MNDVEIIDLHARSCPATYSELLAKYTAVCKERDELKKREKHGNFTDKEDLVSKTELLAHLDECIAESEGCTPIVDSVLLAIKGAVEQMPTVDDISIKHGYWLPSKLDSLASYYSCSECGMPAPEDDSIDFINILELNYCPYCGANMEEDNNVV